MSFAIDISSNDSRVNYFIDNVSKKIICIIFGQSVGKIAIYLQKIKDFRTKFLRKNVKYVIRTTEFFAFMAEVLHINELKTRIELRISTIFYFSERN